MLNTAYRQISRRMKVFSYKQAAILKPVILSWIASLNVPNRFDSRRNPFNVKSLDMLLMYLFAWFSAHMEFEEGKFKEEKSFNIRLFSRSLPIAQSYIKWS